MENTLFSAPRIRVAASPFFTLPPDAPIQEAAVNALLYLIREGHSLALGFSAGKDSTCCLILLTEAVRRAQMEGFNQSHYVNSANTGVENPMMEYHLATAQQEITEFAQRSGLPIIVNTGHPSPAACFVASTIGRGRLPRFPENADSRTCSVDWKVSPAQRLAKALEQDTLAGTGRELITVIGTRFSESAARAERMANRGESATVPVRDSAGVLVISPIAHWGLDDVWATLESVLDPSVQMYDAPISAATVYRLFELYRDAHEGTCGVTLGDKGNKNP